MTDWIQLLTIASNLSIIVVGLKLIRHLSRMELKVEMMWTAFAKKFNLTADESSSSL